MGGLKADVGGGGFQCEMGGIAGIRTPCFPAPENQSCAAAFAEGAFLEEAEFLLIGHPFSIVLWLRTSNTDSGIKLGASVALSLTTDEQAVGLNSSGQGIAMSVEDGASTGTATSVAGGDIRDGDWHFLAGRFASTTSRKINVDGTAAVEDTTSVAYTIGGRLRLAISGNVSEGNPLKGDLDQVAFFSKSLSDLETAWMYNSGTGRTYDEIVNSGDADNPGTTNLLSHYSLNPLGVGGVGADDHGSFDLSQSGTVTKTDGIPAGD